MSIARVLAFLCVCCASAEGALRGRLWIEWQGKEYHHWAGEAQLSNGKILRARCRRMADAPGILKSHDERRVTWRTATGYDGGACESVVLDMEAPESAQVTLKLSKGTLTASLAHLRREKKEVFSDASCLSLEFRILFPKGGVERLERVKKLHPQTPLVSDGRALAIIVVGSSPVHAAQAQRIQRALGIPLDILEAADVVDADFRLKTAHRKTHHWVLLGDINSNPALVHLYAQRYVIVDAQFPGDGGFLLKTVSDPWGTGKNALVIGAGDDAGLSAAVDKLLSLPEIAHAKGSVTLPALAVLEYGKRGSVLPPALYPSILYPEYGMLEKRGIKLIPGSPVVHDNLHNFLIPLALLGLAYNLTGDAAIPAHVKAKLDELGLVAYLRDHSDEFAAWRKANPDKFHLFFRGVARGWDLLEESPVFSEADRLAVTNALWNIMNGMCTRRDKFWLKPDAAELQQGILIFHSPNHETWSALALYELASYFKRYYPELEESDYWLELARAEFAGHETTFEMIEDAKSFQARNTQSCLQYALSSGNMGYLRRGIAKAAADFECVVTDNLGHGCGFGDADLTVLGVPTDVPLHAEWYYREGEYQWLAQRLWRNATKVPPMACRVTPRRPDRFLGIHVLPARRWAQSDNIHYRSQEWVDFPKDPTEAYNKVSFREAFSPQAQYLLLDGRLRLAYHGHSDSNSIVRFTDNGRMWIVDDHPSLREAKHQNGLSFDREGVEAKLGSDAVIRHVADLRHFGLLESEVPVFGSAAWTRSVLWRKGDWFVVFDQLKAKDPGDYLVRCHWRLRGEPRYDANGVTLEQQGERFRLHGATPCALRTEALDMTEIWGPSETGVYDFAKPVCHVLHQEQRRVIEKNATITFANLFYAFSDQEPLALSLAHVSESAALLSGTVRGQPLEALVGVSAAGLGTLATDAALFYLDPTRLACAGMTRLSLKGQLYLESSAAVSLEFGDGAAVLHVPKAARVRVLGAEARTFPAGTHTLDGLAIREADLRHALDEAMQLARQREVARKQAQATVSPAISAPTLWRMDAGAKVTASTLADLDGDGHDELLVGTEAGQAFALRVKDGSRVWSFQAEGRINALEAVDVDGDGQPEALVCARDAHCVNGNGKERWRFQTSAVSAKVERQAYAATAGRLKGLPGRSVLVADARLNVLSAEGKLLWHQPPDGSPLPGKWMPHHFLTAADVDGDGFDDALGGVNMTYPFVYAINGQRELVWRFPAFAPSDYRVSRLEVPGRVVLLRCADIDGDGRVETVTAGTSKGIRMAELSGGAWSDYALPMVGAPTAVAIREGKNGQPGWILAADDSYFLALFHIAEAKPERLAWRKRGDEPVCAVAFWESAAGLPLLVAGGSGNVWLLDAQGETRSRLDPAFPGTVIRICPQPGALVAVTAEGHLEARKLSHDTPVSR